MLAEANPQQTKIERMQQRPACSPAVPNRAQSGSSANSTDVVGAIPAIAPMGSPSKEAPGRPWRSAIKASLASSILAVGSNPCPVQQSPSLTSHSPLTITRENNRAGTSALMLYCVC